MLQNVNILIKCFAYKGVCCTCTSVQLCRTALILAWMTSEVQWASQTSMATMKECLSSWESSSRGSSSRPAELRYFPHDRQGIVALCLIAWDRLSSSSLSTDSSADTQHHELRNKLISSFFVQEEKHWLPLDEIKQIQQGWASFARRSLYKQLLTPWISKHFLEY